MDNQAIERDEASEYAAFPPETLKQWCLLILGAGALLLASLHPLTKIYNFLFHFEFDGDFVVFVLSFFWDAFILHLIFRLFEYSIIAAKTEWTGVKEVVESESETEDEAKTIKGKRGNAKAKIQKEDTSTGDESEGTGSRKVKRGKPGAKIIQQIAQQQQQKKEEEREKARLLAERKQRELDEAKGWSGSLALLQGKLLKTCPETGELGPCVHADRSPAEISLLHDDVNLAKDLILSNQDKLPISKDGRSVLSIALSQGQNTFSQWFLTTKAIDAPKIRKLCMASDSNGMTPLMIACEKGSAQVVALLCEKNVDLTVCDEKGNTALMWACKSGNMSCIRELLRRLGPKAKEEMTRTNKSQERPLCIAAMSDSKSVIHYLGTMEFAFGDDCADHPSCPDYMCEEATCHKPHVPGDVVKYAAKEGKKNAKRCTWCQAPFTNGGKKMGHMPCTNCTCAHYCNNECMEADRVNHTTQCPGAKSK